jgi:hypothetical protein
MRKIVLALLLLLPAAGILLAGEPPSPPPGPIPTETACFKCHSQLDGELAEPTKHAQEDIHFLKGLSCHDCHGGNPSAPEGDMDAAHDVKKGWGKPARTRIPEFCAKCHSNAAFMKKFDPHVRVDQLSEYRTSVHGQKNAAGDAVVAVCVDCHGVHGIRAVGDSRSSVYPTHVAETCAKCHADATKMQAYGIPSNQYEDYKKSVHYHAVNVKGDISAPTCNDCHGSHGAVPPGVESVSSVCGSCHTREATLFHETEAKKKMDLSACIRCMVCHSNHAVTPPTAEMLGVGKGSTCTGCHSAGEPGYVAAEKMDASSAQLGKGIADATALLNRAERKGMEVSEDRFALQKAQDSLVESRVLAHAFDLERFLTVTNAGIAASEAGIAAGHKAFAELRFRRIGLSLSLLVIAAVIIGLALKVREMERRPQG